MKKSVLNLNIVGGVDTKQDERLNEPGKLTLLENALFDDAPTPVRRYGVHRPTLSGDMDTQFHGLTSYNNKLIAETTGSGLLRQANDGTSAVTFKQVPYSGDTKWDFRRVEAEHKPACTRNVDFGSRSYTGFYDCYANGTHRVYVTDDYDTLTATHLLKVIIEDEDSGAIVAAHSINAGAAVRAVKVAPDSGTSNYQIFFQTSATVVKVAVASTSSIGAASTIYTATVALHGWDVIVDPEGYIWFTALDQTGAPDDIITWKQIVTGAVNHTVSGTRAASATDQRAITSVAYEVSGTMHLVVLWCDAFGLIAARSTYVIASGPATAAFGSTVDVDPGIATYVGRLTAIDYGGQAFFQLAFETRSQSAFSPTTSPPTTNIKLYRITKTTLALNTAYTFTRSSPYYLGWGIHSKLFASGGTNRFYLPVALYTTTNPTVAVYDVTDQLAATGGPSSHPHCVARLCLGEAGNIAYQYSTTNPLPNTPSTDDSGINALVAYPKWTPDLQFGGTRNITPEVLWGAELKFSGVSKNLTTQDVAGIKLFTGGCPYSYDGEYINPLGFSFAPQFMVDTVSPSVGVTNIGEGTFQFCITVSYKDNAGNWVESEPSNAVTMVTTAANQTIPATLIPVIDTGDNEKFRVNWYRTENGLTTFYRMYDYNGTTLLTDAQLTDELYTTGDVLPNQPLPGMKASTVFDNRLFFVMDDGQTVGYTKELTFGYGIRFHTTFVRRAPSSYGRLVGLATIGPNVVVFGERKIGIIRGTGPDGTGVGDNFSDIETVFEGYGADFDSPGAILTTADGVWFKSPKGYRCFTSDGIKRDQTGKEAGSEVDSLMSGPTVAIHHPTKQSVWFYQPTDCLVYDELFGSWSRMTNSAITVWTNNGAAAAESSMYHATAAILSCYDETQKKCVDDPNTSSDADRSFDLSLQTPWINVAGVQGFQRVVNLMLLAYQTQTDFDNTGTEAQTFAIDYAVDYTPTWTTLASTFSYTANRNNQWTVNLPTQKCESIRFRIKTHPSFVGVELNTRGVRIASLALEIGVKSGMYKLPSSKRYS